MNKNELVDGKYYLITDDNVPQVGQYNHGRKLFEYVENWNDCIYLRSVNKIIPLSTALRANELQAENEQLRTALKQIMVYQHPSMEPVRIAKSALKVSDA